MTLVVFIGEVGEAEKARYLELAAILNVEVQNQPGFLGVERFVSVSDPKRILSLSRWQNLEDADRWRGNPTHAEVQQEAKRSIFERYTIDVAEVVRNRAHSVAQDG